MKIVSWNIAGARPTKSSQQFDYLSENISYFANQISKYNPDLVCLQESHTNSQRSVAGDLAEVLGMDYVLNTPKNKSHIDPGYMLGDAILSSKPFEVQMVNEYPNQWEEYYFIDGTKGTVHYKTLQEVKVGDVFVGNTQMLPISLFGYQYDKDGGLILAKKIEKVLMRLHRPLILCGDINFSEPEKIYGEFYRKFNLKDALPSVSTVPVRPGEKENPDHILFSSEFDLVNSEVIKTNSDHYMCYADLELIK